MSNTKRKSLRGVGNYINNDRDGGQQAAPPTQEKHRSLELQKQDSAEAQKNRSKVTKKNASSEAQKKVGYYLPPSLVDELEESWFQARRITQEKISKSDFVRAALEEAIENFEEHGEESAFAQRLIARSD